MNYKVGDRVKIQSLDWYNKNRNKINEVECGVSVFVSAMTPHCGCIRTISKVFEIRKAYYLLEDDGFYTWTDEMIEGLVEEGNNHLTETVVDAVRESNDRYRIVIDPRFDIEVDEGEYYAVRRKKEYPKTYEECCNVLSLGEDGRLYTKGYKASLIQNFQKLLVCLDAYWKIAGDWKPEFRFGKKKYCIMTKL